MDKYETITRRIMDKREAYMTSKNIESRNSAGRRGGWINGFEKFIHEEYKQEILQLLKENMTIVNENKRLKNINVSSDLIKLHSGDKKKKKKTQKRKRKRKL